VVLAKRLVTDPAAPTERECQATGEVVLFPLMSNELDEAFGSSREKPLDEP